jgi:putative oxidoreductase
MQIETYLKSFGKYRAKSDLVFRIAISLIFIVGGLGHFREHQYMLDRMATSPWAGVVNSIGDASVLLWMSGAVFVIAGLAIAAGYKTRLAALALFVTLVPITLAIHVAPGHMGPFLKNIAILGSLIHFFFNGPGRCALDKED